MPEARLNFSAWNFGDGTTGSGASVNHIFATVGSFQAVLTVTDNHGVTATFNLPAVTTSKPVGAATETPASGNAPLTVNFNASSSTDNGGTITSYTWNFGDGATGSGAILSHVYNTMEVFILY